VAGLLMEQFGARWVRVSIAKLGMMRGVKRVGVIIERGVRE
jgi:dihydroneopterin aldolase